MARESLEKAHQCLAEKNYIGSILWLRRGSKMSRIAPVTGRCLGESLAQVPEYRREAVEQFEKAIELDPRNLMAHLRYAQLLEQVNMPWRARPLYVRVLELGQEPPGSAGAAHVSGRHRSSPCRTLVLAGPLDGPPFPVVAWPVP